MIQPPSGGCVLKLAAAVGVEFEDCPAAFGRLCVETLQMLMIFDIRGASRLRAAVC